MFFSAPDSTLGATGVNSSVHLSERGLARLKAILEDTTSIMHYLPERYYDPVHNRDGMIVMGVAENQLMTEDFNNYIKQHFALEKDHFRYREFLRCTNLTLQRGFVTNTDQALPLYINDTFSPLEPVTSENSVVGPGVGTLITEFFWQICDVGELALVTALNAVEIPPEVDPLSPEVVSYLEQRIKEEKQKPIRALILCNPHNPLGRVYPKETIIAYAKLAEKYDLHLLVDEIYGNQVYSSKVVPHPPPFVSILSLNLKELAGCNPARVHVVAGPPKDFGASGLRIGIFVSQNPALIKLLQASMMGNAISNSTDAIFTTALMDREWRNNFLAENKKRVGEAYDRVHAWCTKFGIPILESYAGQFAVLDLTERLNQLFPHMSALEQRTAAIKDMAKANVLMWHTGKDQVPTRFRMVFVCEPEILTLALRRLENAFQLKSVNGEN
ncbi:PLP-dependent transferase [Coniophora puteana RWD-64-598 SS2]|uniref:PLP-dependent transferase n=1 Tax=Coniophora puteana (strain RWD-64-598) TaxID=741705 RepID=A0A5M3MX54_CONPW|nr:PLP-dependent transferase [Coniophora puteana RWD-64-598 SS2]EIW83723.1 PLP-dependent transferase [Coniophora puteana RWD-64-598 SS2]